MGRLEDECERAFLQDVQEPAAWLSGAKRDVTRVGITHDFLEYGLDQLGESEVLLVGLGVVDVLAENGDRLGVGLRLKLVTALGKDETELARVGDDTVVDDGKVMLGIGALRVRVDLAGDAVSGPTCVGDGALLNEGLVHVDIALLDELAELGNLSNLLDEGDFARLVTVDANAWRWEKGTIGVDK